MKKLIYATIIFLACNTFSAFAGESDKQDSILQETDIIYAKMDLIYSQMDKVYGNMDKIYQEMDAVYSTLDSLYNEEEGETFVHLSQDSIPNEIEECNKQIEQLAHKLAPLQNQITSISKKNGAT